MEKMNSPFGSDLLDPSHLSVSNGIHHGEFFIGPIVPPVNATPVRNIVECLAKQDGSDGFVTLKVLTVTNEMDSVEDRQGKVLLHNEHLILSLLQDQPGVIHHHSLFKNRNQFILVLDCLVAHDFDHKGRYKDFVNLQHYVIKEKRLHEKEALELFCAILTTVQDLHKKNIVHRDLKLGNMVLNTRTRTVTLTNFALSKHLVRESDLLTDQRGSLAYVSPDVLSGNPYCGKASDMWAAGVLLYTMLYGQFPFYDNDPQELFRKIRAADYSIPSDGHVSMETSMLTRQLIELDAKKRLSATKALETVQSILSRISVVSISEPAQIVPAMGDRKRDAELMVPDQQEDDTPMATDTNLASNIDMNAVRLTLSPILLAESHAGHVIHNPAATNGALLGSPYGSPSAGHLFPYVLTADVQPHLSHPRASSNGNPFICCPSPAPGILSGSPTHSLNSTSPTSSLGAVSFLPSNPSYSYPPPTFFSHRHPLTLSLSSDSYFSSASAFHSHLRSQSLFSPISSASHLENPLEAQSVVSSDQNVMESLVTFRSPSHGIGDNRHSYSDGDVLNTSSLLSPYHSHQRRRRNSSGSERLRRHSHGTHSNSLGDALSLRRARRRSHDESVQLLENLRVAAVSPRTSNRTQSQFNFVPIRVLSPTENP